jgi:hypothetical protein
MAYAGKGQIVPEYVRYGNALTLKGREKGREKGPRKRAAKKGREKEESGSRFILANESSTGGGTFE